MKRSDQRINLMTVTATLVARIASDGRQPEYWLEPRGHTAAGDAHLGSPKGIGKT